MFGNFTIGLLVGAGFGTWVYSKMTRKTGNNTQQAVTVAVLAGAGATLVVTTLLSFIPTS